MMLVPVAEQLEHDEKQPLTPQPRQCAEMRHAAPSVMYGYTMS